MMHLRLERRSSTPAWFSLALPLAALAATLILCSGLVALAGANVFDAYAQLFLTPFSTSFDLEQMRVDRAAWGFFRDRRPELYTELLTLDGGGVPQA